MKSPRIGRRQCNTLSTSVRESGEKFEPPGHDRAALVVDHAACDAEALCLCVTQYFCFA